MATYTVKLADLEAKLRYLSLERRNRIVKAVQLTCATVGLRMVQEEISSAKPTPVDRGTYRRSWQVQNLPDGARIYNPLLYASVIEHGRRPGARRPPVEALTKWVLRKGLVRGIVGRDSRTGRYRQASTGDKTKVARGIAFAIAKKIGERGQPARGILAKAVNRMRAELRTAVIAASKV